MSQERSGNKSSLREEARRAKRRIKTGFWTECQENIDLQKEKAREQGLNEFLLISKDVGFVLIFEIVINHTPYRGFTRTRNKGNNLDGVLSVENIVNSVTFTNLYRVDLVKVEVFRSLFNMGNREISLIILV